MILADKIIRLRKKYGWSQEELAEKMNVSRQAVSKWEAAQTTPDLDKILQLSALFGVTTDYLLKDEIEDEEFTDDTNDTNVKKLSLSEANAFIAWRKTASVLIALATMLCIVSIMPLLILTSASQLAYINISENLAGGIGIISLFLIISVAVVIFTSVGFKNKPYEFLDNEYFETEYGVVGMVKERQKAYHNTYIKTNIIAIFLCVISPVPLICGSFSDNDFLCVLFLIVTLLTAGAGAMLFIIAGVRWASMQKILKEGNFTQKEKKKSKVKGTVTLVYWLIITAIYLTMLFTSDQSKFQNSWIIWPIAGVLFVVVIVLCDFLEDKYDKRN